MIESKTSNKNKAIGADENIYIEKIHRALDGYNKISSDPLINMNLKN
jgi:hypothetical protein